MTNSEKEPLKLRFLGSLVEQLGAQLYPGTTATIAELISNAWDADAKNVWIDIPLDASWTENDSITVIDDGAGMSYDEAATHYLQVGRKRRVELDQDTSPGGRPLHGRKGIGKLAAFGTAKILECLTVDINGVSTHFRLDYDTIRNLAPVEDYLVESLAYDIPLSSPDGTKLPHGTRITLHSLHPRRKLNEEQFRLSLARRFALDTTEMRIFLNGIEVGRFDLNIDIKFPKDGALLDDVQMQPDEWGISSIDDNQVKWWIGFTKAPLQNKEFQGVSVLARGKLVQRPFFFQQTAGIEGQLGQEYMVGEIQADWLDIGQDIDTDLIQANRDQLQLEDDRIANFLKWGRNLLKEALREWSGMRRQRIKDKLDLEEFDDLLDKVTQAEKKRLARVVEAIAAVPAIDIEDARSLVASIVDAHQDTIIRQLLETIDITDSEFQTQIWDIINQFSLIDARRNQTMIEARLKTIAELRQFVDEGALEVPTIHEHIKQHPWLLDPRWYLLDDEVKLSELGILYDKDENDRRMDYLFALGPSAPYTHDELLVVEIKRGAHHDGRVRKVDQDEVSRFHGYVVSAKKSQETNTQPLRVTGLMIAQGYTRSGDDRRISLQTLGDVRLVFSTWHRVLQETERLHEGWLAVTSRRAQAKIDQTGAEEDSEVE